MSGEDEMAARRGHGSVPDSDSGRVQRPDYEVRAGAVAGIAVTNGLLGLVTLGFYRDLQHFAQRSDLTPEQADEAARAAGFEASNRIGTYLRTLIDYHHDTLAVAVE